MRTTLRSFSLGILTTAILLGIIYLQSDSNNEDTKLTVENTSTYLENEGFHVVANSEWLELNETLNSQKQQLEEKNNTDKQQQEEQQKEENQASDNKEQETAKEEQTSEEAQQENKKEEETKPITIDIASGMTTYDVADLLIEAKLIKDKMEFINYLEDNDYAKYIQIGTFELKSGMSLYEISEVLTN